MPQSMSDANKMKAMREEFVSFDTDAVPLLPGVAGHPRAYGAFARLLGSTSAARRLTLEERMLPRVGSRGQRDQAYDRGRLAPGLAADIVVFDPSAVRDRATFAEPTLTSEGFRTVLVNGQVVLDGGRYTGAKPGPSPAGPGLSPQPPGRPGSDG
ncbi:MAG: amidohydrolase family protein [Vicinamibacterales bacterium]